MRIFQQSMIQNFYRQVLRVLPAISTVLLILLLEAGFSTFDNFYDRLTPALIEKQIQFRRLLAGELLVDTAFVGSSTAMFGVNPDIIDAKTGWHSFNAGQLGYAPANLSASVIEDIVRSGRVNRIVYCMDSWALSSPIRDRAQVDAINRGDNFLWNWRLYRNRDVFFFWVRRFISSGWSDPSRAWHDNMVEDGRILQMSATRFHNNGHLDVISQLNPTWPSYIRPSGTKFVDEQFNDFDRAVTMAKAAGIEFVLVRMPEFQKTYDEYAEKHAELSQFLVEYSVKLKIAFVDFSLPEAFPYRDETLFFDIHHLNATGAAIFSSLLGGRLARLENNGSMN